MRKIIIKKLFNGYASLKDYMVYKAMEKGESLLVAYKGDEMILTPGELKMFKQLTTQSFTKKFVKPGENPFYHLLDYLWVPTNEKLKLF